MILKNSYNLQLLRNNGDPVEQKIFNRLDSLAALIEPYANVWAAHILPRRYGQSNSQKKPDKPWKVDDAWMAFAGSHYTALISSFHALEKLERIVQICEVFPTDEFDPEAVLELHDNTEAFWHRMAQAIDHLTFAFDDAPFPNPSHSAENLQRKWKRSRTSKRETLLTLYSRVPAMVDKKLYRTLYPRTWRSFVHDTSVVWRELEAWLAKCESPPE